jgi:sugar phosphate isomerase/epimerase
MLHIHAKDETLDQDGLYGYGAFELGLHTHIGKVPGRGDIDWSAFIGRLLGDEGAISIELQDATFERTTSSGDSDGY